MPPWPPRPCRRCGLPTKHAGPDGPGCNMGCKIEFSITESDDPELTCMACNRRGCDLEVDTSFRFSGRRVVQGLHGECLRRHTTREKE